MVERLFYAVCFGFIFGVLWRSFIFVNLYFLFLLGVIVLGLFVFFYLGSRNKWGIIFCIFILTFIFGILIFHNVDKPAPQIFETKVGTENDFNGFLVDEPDIRENSQKLLVETNIGEEKTKVLVSVGLEDDFKYGDEIDFSGELEKAENFMTDYGKEFDYINYLRKDGIFYVMNRPTVKILSHDNGSKFRSILFSVKNKFLSKMNMAIGTPENLLMGGLILGEKSAFDQSLRQSFVDTGTIHIVALSGYNVTIVAEWIMKVFSFLPKNLGIGVGIFAILLFVLMTGASSTAIRAGVMATLALIARATGRNYDVGRALILAGIGMILFNPFVLVYDVSFQLSFIATIAVIFLVPRIEKYFLWVTKKFGLRDIITVTTAAYVFVLPFIVYKMGNFSVVALPANILILPFIPLTMAFGFFTGLAGLVWYVFAIPFGYFSYFLLHYELFIINFFSHLPFAAFSIPNFPLFLTILIYIYFIYCLFGRSIKKFFIEPF